MTKIFIFCSWDTCSHFPQLMSYVIAQEMRARMPARIVKPESFRKPKHWMAN